jgi:hypothetical protein
VKNQKAIVLATITILSGLSIKPLLDWHSDKQAEADRLVAEYQIKKQKCESGKLDSALTVASIYSGNLEAINSHVQDEYYSCLLNLNLQ